MDYFNRKNENESFLNKFSSIKKQRKCSDAIEIVSQETLDEQLEKSLVVLERISRCEKIIFKKTNESDLPFCMHCKIFIDSAKKIVCNYCENIFCEKHKQEMRHNCPKMPKDEKIEAYQNAKNMFQMRLKQIKIKSAS